MTRNDKNLLEAVSALLATYSDELSDYEIDGFNDNLNVLLERYGVSLKEYHDLLLEEVQEMVENGD